MPRRVLRQPGRFLVVDAQHRQPVERQPVQELRKRRLHPCEIASVVLEVIGIDVGHHGDHRIEPQETPVALVGLGHQPVAAAQARVGAGGKQLAADDEGRIQDRKSVV